MSITLWHVRILLMKKRLTYHIDSTMEQQTIEQFLRSLGYSRNLMIHLRSTPLSITVDTNLAYTTHRLSSGEVLTIQLEETEVSKNIVPVPMDLNIIYEDEDILVVCKPANTPVHPSQGYYDCTLANGLAHYFQQKGEPFVYRAVNRLDRDTTGLLIIARHQLSASILSHMVQNREIHREYLAAADGKTDCSGTICAPIARAEGSTIERCVSLESGEYACTHYRRLHYSHTLNCSLVSLVLDTGRTHQIRVHMKYIGHPLYGDFLYNPDYRFISRQALHSHRLCFLHPLTKERLQFEAPLPEDMQFCLR